jgi:hypothetical protein
MKRFSSILILFFVLTACFPIKPAVTPLQPWQLSDLRFLDLPNTTDPTSDLIAIYSRINGIEFQFRFDILDMQPDFNFDLYIALDTIPSGNRSIFPGAPTAISPEISDQGWDQLIAFPLKGDPHAYVSGNSHPEPGLTPVVQRDPLLDMVTVSFNRNRLPTPENLIFQVFITTTDGELLLDQSPPVSILQANLIPPAPLILAFSDTFPAISPAQALRRWDGAHTGPTGERHGLKHILSNAEIYDLPVVLLDLKNPSSLSALDFIGVIPQIQNLVSRNLLLLPNIAFAQPDDLSLQISRNTASAFHLPASVFVYSTEGQLQADYRFQFVNLPDRTHLLRQAGRILIPSPDLTQSNPPIQATNEGLSLEVRHQLLLTALSPDRTDLVVLGGSLPHSTWGDSDMGTVSMAYIAAHPWIQTLNAQQIQAFISQPIKYKYEPPTITFPPFPIFTSQGNPIDLNSTQLHTQLLQDLRHAPQNTITDSAWQMFFSLTSSSNPLSYQTQYQYLNQVQSLLTASHWMEFPATLADCSRDIDFDSLNECVLSNPRFFAIIETDGGRLSFLFIRSGDQVHQLIGPLSQFLAGISDPSQWHPEKGPGADPSEIPGAFSDSDIPFMLYQVADLTDGSLTLNRSDGQIKKTFRLAENSMTIDYITGSTMNLSIPLAINPQARFQSDWAKRFSSQSTKDFFRWRLEGNTGVEIRSSAAIISANYFKESNLRNTIPEDPNLDYPPGHFLPFPLAMVEISGFGKFSVDILILE